MKPVRRKPFERARACLLAGVASLLGGCYSYSHYTQDPSALDYTFFGQVQEESDGPAGEDSGDVTRLSQGWQAFYLWGLMPWFESTPTFAAEELAALKLHEPEELEFTIETGKSALNVLAEGALSAVPIVGFVWPFFFNWRSLRVRAGPLRSQP